MNKKIWEELYLLYDDLIKTTVGLSIYPLGEFAHLKADEEKFYKTLAILVNNGKIHDSCELKPGEIENFNLLKSKFGEKIFSEINEEKFLLIVEKYKKLLFSVKTIQVYEQGGWFDNESFILENLLITKNEVKKILRFYETQKDVELIQDFEFIIPHILGIFENKTLSIISLIYLILSLLNSRLPQNSNSFSTLLAFIGQSGSRKTSFVTAFFNPLGNSANNCSFEDSRAAVEESFRSLKDGVLIVDDAAKDCGKYLETLEKLIRLTGDKTTAAKKIRGKKILTAKNKPLVVITGEVLPKLQTSSLARMLVIDLSEDYVNLENLTILQKNSMAVISFQISFLQFIMKNENFLQDLFKNFEELRIEFSKKEGLWHPRCASAIAWFIAGGILLNQYFGKQIVDIKELEKELFLRFKLQWELFGSGDAVFNYLQMLNSMLESGEIPCIDGDFKSTLWVKKIGNEIIFPNEPVFKKIIFKLIENGREASIGNKKLLKELNSEHILIKSGDKNTFPMVNSNGFSVRCIKLNYRLLHKKLFGMED